MVRTLWFFWNWFDFLTRGDEPRGATNLVQLDVDQTDPLVAVVLGVAGVPATAPRVQRMSCRCNCQVRRRLGIALCW